MKDNKIFIVFIAIFLVLIGVSSNVIKNKENKIVVEKRVNGTDEYEFYSEIMSSKEVQNARDILSSIKWENATVNMVRNADYVFHFEDTREKQKPNGLIYALWISPDKDKIELVIDSEVKYVQLDKEKSEKLFKIITGKNLSET
ncbi:hypothetical protein CDLVIII_3034 [Clostridium sp. DL-VIII]|uniref:hypothetical protein n=1 Tax=Clostridium sp. DL-VIII TaxID=641107 RepID=UPI00023AFD87|nr:hypothetical protein [Clostridium sp. DL-VIII]EHI99620.1 hypothetical protein CDLVIII_3034 [Clostridium sp. DL-VIII]